MIKNAILRKKIDGIIYDLMLQSTGDIVELSDGTTLNAKIAQIISSFANIVSEETINNKISESTSDLYKRVTGIDENTTINEAYDTIKEVADWLSTEEATSSQDIVNNITSLEEAVTALEQAATKVTASETNGNIIVDGKEVEVYKHPETHSVDEIVETEEKQFTSQEEIDSWNATELIIYQNASEVSTSTTPENATGLVIGMDTVKVNFEYTNENNESLDFSDTSLPSVVEAEAGSSKFVQFTIPEGYTLTSITDGDSNAIQYTVDHNNVVRFTLVNLGNLNEDDFSYTEENYVYIKLSTITTE